MMDQNQQSADATQPQDESTTVCITANGDGTFKVYEKGDDSPTMQGGYPSSDGDDAGQTAPDIDSALQLAKQLLGGQGGEPGAEAPDDAESLFQGGFNGARGQLNQG
jgi:hypothetical protein